MSDNDTLQRVLDAVVYYQTGAARFPTREEWLKFGGTIREDPFLKTIETKGKRTRQVPIDLSYETFIGPDGREYHPGDRLHGIDAGCSIGAVRQVPRILIDTALHPLDSEKISVALEELLIDGALSIVTPSPPMWFPTAPFCQRGGSLVSIAEVDVATGALQGPSCLGGEITTFAADGTPLAWVIDLDDRGLHWSSREVPTGRLDDPRLSYCLRVSIDGTIVVPLGGPRDHLFPEPAYAATATSLGEKDVESGNVPEWSASMTHANASKAIYFGPREHVTRAMKTDGYRYEEVSKRKIRIDLDSLPESVRDRVAAWKPS